MWKYKVLRINALEEFNERVYTASYQFKERIAE